MNTIYKQVDRDHPDRDIVEQAAAFIRQGGLVAFPTETVYGLGANGLDGEAVAGIYRAKGRPSDNPLILHIARPQDIENLVQDVNDNARALIQAFWPGPLTVILPRKPIVPDAVTGGLDTVAVRLPSSPTAQLLIALSGTAIAAPSANTSGRPSPTDAAAVMEDLAGKIDMVLDAGPCDIGVESTVVDCTTPVPTILRPGGITREMITSLLGAVEFDPALVGADVTPRAPGMKYRHYAPKAPVTLVEARPEDRLRILRREAQQALADGKRLGLLVSAEAAAQLKADALVVILGKADHPETAAANLFRALRRFDEEQVDCILAEGMSEEGIGLAVMNRLRKSSGYHILKN